MTSSVAVAMRSSLIKCLKAVAMVATVLGACPGGSRADDASFTKQMAERLSRELPGQRIEIVDVLTLQILQADGTDLLQANLDRLSAFCAKSAENCEAATAQYVGAVAETIQDRVRPIDASQIRLNVRARKGMEEAQRALSPEAPGLLMRPFAGDLALVVALDFPATMRMFTSEDARKLRITEEQAIEIGRKNLQATLKPLSDYPAPTGKQSIRYLDDSPYEASRMLLHAEWTAVAKALGGSLVVGVPSPDLLVYGRGDSARALEALRTFVYEAIGKAESPLSASLFRWTANGWEEIR
jgi:uncharacterized protein YtpQ (UPF0354 family)